MTPHPYQSRTAFIDPFNETIYQHGSLYVQRLGRILDCTDDCRDIHAGDVVVFRPYAYDETEWSGGTLYVISEKAIVAIIEGYDEGTYVA